jgi:hypothetical protein
LWKFRIQVLVFRKVSSTAFSGISFKQVQELKKAGTELAQSQAEVEKENNSLAEKRNESLERELKIAEELKAQYDGLFSKETMSNSDLLLKNTEEISVLQGIVAAGVQNDDAGGILSLLQNLNHLVERKR